MRTISPNFYNYFRWWWISSHHINIHTMFFLTKVQKKTVQIGECPTLRRSHKNNTCLIESLPSTWRRRGHWQGKFCGGSCRGRTTRLGLWAIMINGQVLLHLGKVCEMKHLLFAGPFAGPAAAPGVWRLAGAGRRFARHPLRIGAQAPAALGQTPAHAGAARAVGELLLKVQELAHEVEVGWDVGFTLLDKIVGVVQREAEFLHEIGDGYGDGATHAGQAVHQDTTLLVTCVICEEKREIK